MVAALDRVADRPLRPREGRPRHPRQPPVPAARRGSGHLRVRIATDLYRTDGADQHPRMRAPCRTDRPPRHVPDLPVRELPLTSRVMIAVPRLPGQRIGSRRWATGCLVTSAGILLRWPGDAGAVSVLPVRAGSWMVAVRRVQTAEGSRDGYGERNTRAFSVCRRALVCAVGGGRHRQAGRGPGRRPVRRARRRAAGQGRAERAPGGAAAVGGPPLPRPSSRATCRSSWSGRRSSRW